jgi:hypothetical protein
MHVQRMKNAKEQTAHSTGARLRIFGRLFDHKQVEIAVITRGIYRV